MDDCGRSHRFFHEFHVKQLIERLHVALSEFFSSGVVNE
jgi:hypothetical protein